MRLAFPGSDSLSSKCWWGSDGIDALCFADGTPYEYEGAGITPAPKIHARSTDGQKSRPTVDLASHILSQSQADFVKSSPEGSIVWHKGHPYRLDKLAGGLAAGEAWDAFGDEGGGE